MHSNVSSIKRKRARALCRLITQLDNFIFSLHLRYHGSLIPSSIPVCGLRGCQPGIRWSRLEEPSETRWRLLRRRLRWWIRWRIWRRRIWRRRIRRWLRISSVWLRKKPRLWRLWWRILSCPVSRLRRFWWLRRWFCQRICHQPAPVGCFRIDVWSADRRR
ncbi:hypothetical protein RvY_08549 [Ramazzottius varieornatus]|uniref:Uncharacterized protein n=1 Tax=Ramazzottius varieornatus TaxID=947166 RepID=A0A1D1V693_RAMVA|nr:hypothetical protein RvY_08549 [Ramazzottius varieornatus]